MGVSCGRILVSSGASQGPDRKQRRGLFHIPIIGAVSGKLFTALALKKVAVTAIVRKLGVQGTIDHFKNLNDALLEKGQR